VSDPVTGVASAFTMLLSVVNKTMDMLPDYEQRKKEKFYKMQRDYSNEKNKEFPNRDDNLVGVYRDRCLQFVAVFSAEISSKKV